MDRMMLRRSNALLISLPQLRVRSTQLLPHCVLDGGTAAIRAFSVGQVCRLVGA